MESEANGKETVTFSTVTKSTSRPEEKAKYKKEGRRGTKPAKAKRDRERRDAWMERRRTAVGKPVAVVPAVAPVTVPETITPEVTDRTMVTGSTPEEAERRRPEPAPAPKTPERTGWGPAEQRRRRPVEETLETFEETCGGEPVEPMEEEAVSRRRWRGGTLWRTHLLPLHILWRWINYWRWINCYYWYNRQKIAAVAPYSGYCGQVLLRRRQRRLSYQLPPLFQYLYL